MLTGYKSAHSNSTLIADVAPVRVNTNQPLCLARQKSLLLKVFDSLRAEEINYCVLRGYDNLPSRRPAGDLDLLVDPEHSTLLSRILRLHGFLAYPEPGPIQRCVFLAYDQDAGYWIKLDVASDLQYGPALLAVCIPIVKSCLRDSRWRPPAYVLSPEHEFITLFLHCLLNKGRFKATHSARLVQLQEEIATDRHASARLVDYLRCSLPPALTPADVDQVVRNRDWERVLNLRSTIIRQLLSRNPLTSSASAFRRCQSRVAQLFRRGKGSQPGLFVALIGADSQGKTALSRSLVTDACFGGRALTMGTHLQPDTLGFPITPARGLNFANHLVAQWYRLGVASYHKLKGRVVVFDGYRLDFCVWEKPQTLTERLQRWMLERGWPKPDLVILLDPAGSLLGGPTEEHAHEWIEQHRLAYLQLKGRLPQMVVIDTSVTDAEVRQAVMNSIWTRLNTIHMGTGEDAQRN